MSVRGKLKLGKGTAFVKSHIKQLGQEGDTWEADFRPIPKPRGQAETHHLGLVVGLPGGHPLAILPVDYTPDVNDLADLLAAALRRPTIDSPHRPRRIAFRADPRWEEMFPHLKELGIDASVQADLPAVDEVHLDFLRQLRRSRPVPLVLTRSGTPDVQKAYPSVAAWVQGFGHIEIGDQEGFGFVVRAVDYGGVVFESHKPGTLAEAMAALEEGLNAYFAREGIA